MTSQVPRSLLHVYGPENAEQKSSTAILYRIENSTISNAGMEDIFRQAPAIVISMVGTLSAPFALAPNRIPLEHAGGDARRRCKCLKYQVLPGLTL